MQELHWSGLRPIRRRWAQPLGIARALPAVLALVAALLGLAAASPTDAEASSGRAQPWRIVHHDIRAALDPGTAGLEVVDTIRLAAPAGVDPGRPIHVLLNRGLRVQSARAGDRDVTTEEQDGFQPRHFWKRPDYEAMEDYAHARELTLSAPGGGWPLEPSGPAADAVELTLALRYAGAVYDSLKPPKVAYGRSFETTTGLIDPRGAFLAGGTFWLPWTGEDLFRFRLETTLPEGWESVSQGTLAGRRAGNGSTVATWVVEHPMNEAYLVAGPYVVREQTHGGVAVRTFTYADTPEDLCRTYLEATGGYLDRYEALIGPYPFDGFAMAENFWQTGFGMPGFTLLGDRVIRLPFIVHTSYGHEILHNWWGNGVFVDADEGNWCEGLTTYLADYTYKAEESEAAARDYRLNQLRGYLDYAGSGERDFALRRFTERDSPATQAVGYGKTMMVFHMTRRLVGDDVFFDGLRLLYRDFLFREAGWDDVRTCFEAVSGRDLDPWFTQWIDRPGAPVLTIARGESRGDRPILVIRQEEPAYDLDIPLVHETDAGVQSTLVHLSGTMARIPVEAGTRWVAVDPDFQLFRKLHRGEVPPTLSQVLGADSTVVVVGSRCAPDLAAAVRELAAEWSRNNNLVVVDEAEFRGPAGRGVWLFGEGTLSDRLFEESLAYGEAPARLRSEAASNGRAVAVCFRDADDPEIPWTVVLPPDAASVADLGRKLPRYGSYSYLAFDGDTVVDKGTWTVERSPLRLDLTEE